jgi:hypothetical protein
MVRDCWVATNVVEDFTGHLKTQIMQQTFCMLLGFGFAGQPAWHSGPALAMSEQLELQQWSGEAQQVALSLQQQQQSTGISCGSLDPRLAAEFMAAVYETVQQQQVHPGQLDSVFPAQACI